MLCHVEGLRHDEVAQRLGCPIGTVESRLSRARERLRSRLERRGLAPTASAMGAILQTPKSGFVLPSLVEATVKAALGQAANPTGIVAALASIALPRVARLIAGLYSRAGAVATALVVITGVAAVGLGVFRVDGETPQLSPTTPTSVGNPAGEVPRAEQVRDDLIHPLRSSSAVARPLSGITIDGRLDDWPRGLQRYPIQRQVCDQKNYDSEPRDLIRHPDAYFQVGYDRQAGLIYLAVVVRDKDSIVHPASLEGPNSIIFKTDAVEVYVDGTFSDQKHPSGEGLGGLDAATMPVLQYVGVPGPVPAYGDRWGANPSLLYSQTRERRTRMKYRRDRDLTTYEWAIQSYDQYPNQLTQLAPGKRIGLDVAVVNKDDVKNRPAWMYWGPQYTGFKGYDASNLGELILAEGALNPGTPESQPVELRPHKTDAFGPG